MLPSNRFDGLIRTLQSKISGQISVDQRSDQNYALLDFPDYSNVGDTLIWIGASSYLEDKLGKPPAYIATVRDFDPRVLADRLPKGPIFLNGGGNFGDIWPHFQEFRINVLRAFPERRVIQLPQTIFFNDPANVEETSRAVSNHGGFTMYTRDSPSYDFAKAHLKCEVALCPDMAFWLGPQQPAASTHDVALMLRTDKERRDENGSNNQDVGLTVAAFDWIHGDSKTFAMKLRNRSHKYLGWPSNDTLLRERAFMRFRRGVRLMSQGERVVTDRLHGHILAILLGKPHALLDNSYGKLRNFYEAWTKGHKDIEFFEEIRSAYDWTSAELKSVK